MTESLYGRALIVIAALVGVAGCGGSSSSVTPPGSLTRLVPGPAVAGPVVVPMVPPPVTGPRGWPNAAKRAKPILFVSDLQGNVVRLYDPDTPNAPEEGTITDSVMNPQGLAVDSKGSLYVSNVGYTEETITVYSPGKSKPRLTIPTPGYYGIAVDSKGDIFATYTGGTVYAYKPGAKKPYESIGGFDNPVGIAIDSKNNVWVSDDSANKVYTIPAGTKEVKDAGLIGLNGPDGISFGTGDTLYVGNFGGYDVTVYSAGSKKPSETITDGITSPNLNAVTAADYFFQANQFGAVVGYKKGQRTPFSTITGSADPLGIASSPLVKK
jgi:sugar lactone lactonase YvrE